MKSTANSVIPKLLGLRMLLMVLAVLKGHELLTVRTAEADILPLGKITDCLKLVNLV